MYQIVIMLRQIFITFLLSSSILCDPQCNNWELFNDEKCYSLFHEEMRTFESARNLCAANNANLISIVSQEQQDFIIKYLDLQAIKTNRVMNSVWIGARFKSGKFEWEDNSEFGYTNWAVGSPRNVENFCVEIKSDESDKSKWVDVPCGKRNLVICQRNQTWSLQKMQETIIIERKKAIETKNKLDLLELNSKNENIVLKNELNNLKKNPVPLGFIYVQLSGQPDAKTIWSNIVWKDVTSEYAGLFFRAEGGKSDKFGQTQNESSPLLSVEMKKENNGIGCSNCKQNISPNTCSGYIFSGQYSGGAIIERYWHKFCSSSDEVRPKNQAIRIWKRIK